MTALTLGFIVLCAAWCVVWITAALSFLAIYIAIAIALALIWSFSIVLSSWATGRG